ncbi:hypothetical protein D4764_06G0003280 [Takifugu flavidus]|uniref:Uncharacterized protein n=1 Tax=Takifugu flavidus TaxID=433684 RepID=A0A5C6MWW0_9TELE|nr:hypothetical protein D4764_06G0003280 [Takifugu flavidus]
MFAWIEHHVEYITEEESAVRTRGIAAKTRKWLQLADQSGFFSPCPSPRLLTRLGTLMSKSMCGCGCSIISSLMKRLGCAVCCSDLFSSHTSEQLQRLAAGCPPQPKNAKPFSSSDSLAKVQEVASWLLEMNQDLLSGGSSSRRSRAPGGPAVRGNASSTARAPQQAADEGDEDEHMNRVVEEEEQLQQRVRASRSETSVDMCRKAAN